jgi:hypothetical protein
MKVVIDMELRLLCKSAIIGVFLAGATAMTSASDNGIIESVKAMERELGLAIAPPFGELFRRPSPARQSPDTYVGGGPGISPDGTAIAWWWEPYPYRGEKIPFLTLKSLKEGEQPVWVEGRVAGGSIGLSSEGAVIVAIGRSLDPLQSRRRELLAIDRRSGVVVHDLTAFVRQFNVGNSVESGNNVEVISVSGPGTLVALGTPRQMQVLEIGSGKTVYAGPGRFPRLSPDGERLAFVDSDGLWIHSFRDGSTEQLLKGKRVKGVGGWSPDGRFLLAGRGQGLWGSLGRNARLSSTPRRVNMRSLVSSARATMAAISRGSRSSF